MRVDLVSRKGSRVGINIVNGEVAGSNMTWKRWSKQAEEVNQMGWE